VRLLLDTQILVWMVNGDRRLRASWIAELTSAANSLHVSAAIAFEYTDLQSRGRVPVDETIAELADRFDLTVADLPADCWRIARQLPPIHCDPVDRMLVAHALAGGMALVTADADIRRYPVPCV
jgi:PIN domain nuclease of toxin-antitoxin system